MRPNVEKGKEKGQETMVEPEVPEKTLWAEVKKRVQGRNLDGSEWENLKQMCTMEHDATVDGDLPFDTNLGDGQQGLPGVSHRDVYRVWKFAQERRVQNSIDI
eukprot:s225_g26.t1